MKFNNFNKIKLILKIEAFFWKLELFAIFFILIEKELQAKEM